MSERFSPPSQHEGTQAPAPPPQKPWYKQWWIWTIGAVVLVAILVVVVLASKDKTEPETDVAPPRSESVEESAAEEAEVVERTETEEAETEQEPANSTFGETFAWPDGLAVTLSPPTEFAISKDAVGTVEGRENVSLDVTVTNGTDETIGALKITVTAVSGREDASRVFDPEHGIEVPTADIPPGESLTWTVAFSVTDPDQVRVTVKNALNPDGEWAIFED